MINIKKITSKLKFLMLSSLLLMVQSVNASGDGLKKIKSIEVLATAYNSVPEQTDDTPFEAAWGDMLSPEVKSIAVSPDLIRMGLKKYSKVEITGLPGKYIVLDKMNDRWEKKIDIYMGTDIDEALEWGIKKVTISWEAE